jgi:hypothetical protein
MVYNPVDSQLRLHCDASFGEKSFYGYDLSMGGTYIATKGGRLKTIHRDGTSCEISSVNEGLSEALWARDVLVELGYPQDSIPIAQDNESCIKMLQKEPRNFQTKSKHVRVKWRFFRQQYDNGLVHLVHCPTELMRADMLTKQLGSKLHTQHSSAYFSGKLSDDWDVV